MKLRDTLSATLLAHADAPRRWNTPLSPDPAKPYPLWLLGLRTLLWAVIFTGLCWLGLNALYGQWIILWWPFWLVVSIGVVWGGMTVLTWNRRAARLRTAAAAGQTPVDSERLPVWAKFTLVPIYYLLFFVLTPLILALSVANSISSARWSSYRAELVARGVELDVLRMAPKPVADADNFASTPFFKDTPFTHDSNRGPNHPFWERTKRVTLPERVPVNLNYPFWAKQQALPLGPVRAALAKSPLFPQSPTNSIDSAAVLTALKGLDTELSEIEGAAARPAMAFPLRYQDTFIVLIPHVTPLRNLSSIYSLRASARLATSDASGALQDVKTGWRLGNFSAAEPLLISYLVGIAMDAQALQPIWEGLRTKAWTEAQLAEMDSLLASRAYAALCRRAVDGERAFSTTMMEMWIGDREELARSAGVVDSLELAAFLQTISVARGRFFIAENLISINRWYDQILPRDGSSPDFRVARKEMFTLLDRPKHPSEALVRVLFPALGNFFEKGVVAQTHQTLARTAIALERHALANGGYPNSLAELTPKFLPTALNDPFSKASLHYAKASDGRYLLYSIGPNGRDDQGRSVKRKSKDIFHESTEPVGSTEDQRAADDIAWTYLPLEK